MDVLIAAELSSAYAYSVYETFKGGEVYFDTAAMIVTLILLGRYIEAGAKGRASATITRLMQLSPKEARKLDLGPGSDRSERRSERPFVEWFPCPLIVPGDLVEVVPGEKIPLDGLVLFGSSEADEAMLTGESEPSPKTAGSPVYGATINLYGSFVFKVTQNGCDTSLARIIQAVEDAQARRAPIQSIADRVVADSFPLFCSSLR